MERIVFFGKGGIGKSTTSSNVSAVLAGSGLRVLHVGCDPKHDSTVQLLHGRMIDAVVDRPLRLETVRPEDIVTRSKIGVDCVEAGGPEAGVGCGGRGISRMLEIFNAARLITPERYDVTVFDVLGDVVCGGFAAPLKKGVGEKLVIVASEEVMALYAANNIARAAVHYQSNGVKLAGIVVNLRDNAEDRAPVERFARLINTRVIGYVPRDPTVREAEYRRMTAVELAPASAIARVYRELVDKILAIDPAGLPTPTPLTEAQFYHYTQYKFAEPPGGLGAVAEEESPPPVAMGETAEALVTLGRSPAADPRAPPKAAPQPSPVLEHRRRSDFEEDVVAGTRAVRLGRVIAEEALRRLRDRYPVEAAALSVADLRS